MKLNKDQFMEQGYLIIPGLFNPRKLETMRTSCEIALERQKVIWARDREPGAPPGGAYETANQPRLTFRDHEIMDRETAPIIEDFWADEGTLDIASQLLCNPEPNITQMWMMVNPVSDHPGGTGWHRDVHVHDMAPMEALANDFNENGPKYVQWNVALYDDDVLWVVPGSHKRINTITENNELRKDDKNPISGGVPVKLKAGDGVVYSNFLLHWGSNYTTKKRRTLHGGHAIFSSYSDLNFIDSLMPSTQDIFTCDVRRSEHKQNVTESVLRSAIDKDAEGYRRGLENLQPNVGRHGKTALTIYLSKIALHTKILKDPEFALEHPKVVRNRPKSLHPITLNWGPEFSDRFSNDESSILWQRFKKLDSLLQSETDDLEPGYQGDHMKYVVNKLPEGSDSESVVRSWTHNN
tara:strand:- start:2249 stop:3475 length:1227 start_codon:yes stop_codon:yes gene_type:complete